MQSLPRQVPKEDILALPHHRGSMRTSASDRCKERRGAPPLRALPPTAWAGRALDPSVSRVGAEPCGCRLQPYSPEGRIIKHWEAGLTASPWGHAHGTGDVGTGQRKPQGVLATALRRQGSGISKKMNFGPEAGSLLSPSCCPPALAGMGGVSMVHAPSWAQLRLSHPAGGTETAA